MRGMHRSTAIGLLAALAACGEPAQDPTRSWSVRLDEATDLSAPGRITPLPGNGVEVQAGPNATLWRRDAGATGTYRLSARVTQRNTGPHAHGAGLVFGGREVDGENQTYTYFLVNGDGTFLVKTRDAASTAILVPWSEHAAVNREKADATTSNDLAVEVGATTTRFLVNNKEVHRAPTATLKIIEGSADGAATLAKLWGRHAADRLRRRKPLAPRPSRAAGAGRREPKGQRKGRITRIVHGTAVARTSEYCHKMEQMATGMMTAIEYLGDADGDGVLTRSDYEQMLPLPVVTISDQPSAFAPGASEAVRVQWTPGRTFGLFIGPNELAPWVLLRGLGTLVLDPTTAALYGLVLTPWCCRPSRPSLRVDS